MAPTRNNLGLSAEDDRNLILLEELLQSQSPVIGFVGAGLSIPVGYRYT